MKVKRIKKGNIYPENLKLGVRYLCNLSNPHFMKSRRKVRKGKVALCAPISEIVFDGVVSVRLDFDLEVDVLEVIGGLHADIKEHNEEI